ncbi:Cro/CI family transcriptional regulator [Bacillus methanolicus PB1]|uniref:Cro/CI family transcriptional regulator n=1 Tax=Bacillus methanolicus PB1 TaxID=997296 RepID=I3E1I3_BACMT|nr:helix-turn-helix transcriptional regulator [Bacillus methanolicus]EIJ80354.1 Cro/CI family transcriptional regulator [Bacillus methanolicus PB1]
MSLSKKLRELRIKKGWTQDFVADMMKVDRSTISRYETGRSLPDYQTILQFAEIFKVEKEYLVAELDPQAEEKDKPALLLKENSNDRELELILELLEKEPKIKDILLEWYNYDDKKRTLVINTVRAFMKEIRHYKR